MIKKEILVISEKYGDDRRTKIGFDDDMSVEDLISDDDTVIAMTNLGYIKRMSVDNFKSQNRGGKGIKGMQTIDEDFIEDLLEPSLHHVLYEHGTLLPDQGVRDPRGRQNSPRNGDRKPFTASDRRKGHSGDPDA